MGEPSKTESYRKLLTLHGYTNYEKGGVKPWSSRLTLGNSHVDVRNSEWTAYFEDKELCSGPDVATLTEYLNGGGL